MSYLRLPYFLPALSFFPAAWVLDGGDEAGAEGGVAVCEEVGSVADVAAGGGVDFLKGSSHVCSV